MSGMFGGDKTTITGNAGGIIHPQASGNFNLVGSGTIVVTGVPATNTLTISGGGVTGMTNHALAVGTAGGSITSLTLGTTGVMLQGVTGNDPAWSTATYPSTVALGDVLVASAANTIGVVNDVVNAGYVLTANVGAAPSFQALPAAPILSVSGTANQITASTVAGAVTLSTPATFIAPGTIASTTTNTAGTDLISTAGNLLLPATSSTVGQIKINSSIVLANSSDGTITNIAVGTGSTAPSGGGVTAVGYQAGFGQSALTAVGYRAGYLAQYNSIGATFVGANTGGQGNKYSTYIGYNSGSAVGNYHHNVYINNDGANEEHVIRIGRYGSGENQQDTAYIAGTLHGTNGLVSDVGDITATSGNLKLPTTTSTVGQIQINSARYFHNYHDNLFVGKNAGNFTISAGGDYNVCIGENSGSTIAVANGCVCLGFEAGKTIYDGGKQIFIGYQAGLGMQYNNSGTQYPADNIAIGAGAMSLVFGNSQQQKGLAIGTEAHKYCVQNSDGGVAIGYKADTVNRQWGVTIGHSANLVNTSGSGVIIGNHACYQQTSGSQAVVLGDYAGRNCVTGNDCILICNDGVNAETHTIRIGTQGTGSYQQNATYIAGIYNTAVGATAGVVLSDSSHQLGGLAGAANTVLVGGTAPSFTASPTLTSLTLTGNLNLPQTTSSVGYINMDGNRYLHSSGYVSNVFLGSEAGSTSAGNGYNIGIGYNCMKNCTSGVNQNVLIGSFSSVHGACFNTMIGAGIPVYDGSYNVAIGTYIGATGKYSGGDIAAAANSNVIIQNPGVSGDNNVIRIGNTGSGNGQQNKFYVAATYGTTPSGTKNIVLIDNNEQLGSTSLLTPSLGGRNTIVNCTSSNSVTLAVNTTYIATSTNGSTKVVFTLPSTSAVGDEIKIIGASSAYYEVDQNSGNTIFYDNAGSTPGATGKLDVTASHRYTSITLTCITTDANWVVSSLTGAITLS